MIKWIKVMFHCAINGHRTEEHWYENLMGETRYFIHCHDCDYNKDPKVDEAMFYED